MLIIFMLWNYEKYMEVGGAVVVIQFILSFAFFLIVCNSIVIVISFSIKIAF